MTKHIPVAYVAKPDLCHCGRPGRWRVTWACGQRVATLCAYGWSEFMANGGQTAHLPPQNEPTATQRTYKHITAAVPYPALLLPLQQSVWTTVLHGPWDSPWQLLGFAWLLMLAAVALGLVLVRVYQWWRDRRRQGWTCAECGRPIEPQRRHVFDGAKHLHMPCWWTSKIHLTKEN